MTMHGYNFFIFLCVSSAFAGNETPVPKYLEIARELVKNVKPQNNNYQHVSDIDFENNIVKTDCSGFVSAVLNHANYTTVSEMEVLKTRKGHPLAEDFVYSIQNKKGLEPVDQVVDVLPGDIFAWSWKKQNNHTTTGHVMLMNSRPELIESYAPIKKRTHQYLVSVIDSSSNTLGDDDSRKVSNFLYIFKQEHHTGVGIGWLRLYADTETGALCGFAKTFNTKNKFRPLNTEKATLNGCIGRPTFKETMTYFQLNKVFYANAKEDYLPIAWGQVGLPSIYFPLFHRP
ncbi:MAG TPA: hypothetical protein DHV51_03220 [Opitutae bacterium]|nr:hypothetical protein [Opitutae bacterium]